MSSQCLHALRDPFPLLPPCQAKSAALIAWSLLGLFDMFRLGRLHDASNRALEGTGSAHAGAGLIDILCYKRAFLDWLLSKFVPERRWPAEVSVTIAKVTVDHQAFRKAVGYPGDLATGQVDLTWRAGWPSSAETFFGRLLEDCRDCRDLGFAV